MVPLTFSGLVSDLMIPFRLVSEMEDEAVVFFRHFQTIPSGILTFWPGILTFSFCCLYEVFLWLKTPFVDVTSTYINMIEKMRRTRLPAIVFLALNPKECWLFGGHLNRVCIPNFKHVTPIGNDMDM